jgi:hypothetical protein
MTICGLVKLRLNHLISLPHGEVQSEASAEIPKNIAFINRKPVLWGIHVQTYDL